MVSVLRSLRAMWVFFSWRQRGMLVALLLVPSVLGGLAGPLLVRRPPQVITETKYVDRVVTQEHTVTVEKPVIQYRDRVITRYVTRPDGTKIETHVEEQSGTQTGGKITTVEEKTAETRESYVKTLPAEPPRLHLIAEFDPYVNLGPGPTLGASATVMGLYDFARLGPVSIFTGLEVIVPVLPSPQPPMFIVPLGVSVHR